MSAAEGLVGRDVYLRFGDGPVQHFRAWDAQLFYASQVEQGIKHSPPYDVRLATEAEYRAQHRWRKP